MKLAITLLASLLIAGVALGQNNGIELPDFQEQIRLNTRHLQDSIPLSATSRCAGALNINYTDKRFSGGCAGVLERTYVISDNCNNSRQAVQYITLVDDTPPVFVSVPEDIVLKSRDEYKSAPSIQVNDESGNSVILEFEEVPDFSDDDYAIITRIWTATDPCDNVSVYKSTVTIPRANPHIVNEE